MLLGLRKKPVQPRGNQEVRTALVPSALGFLAVIDVSCRNERIQKWLAELWVVVLRATRRWSGQDPDVGPSASTAKHQVPGLLAG